MRSLCLTSIAYILLWINMKINKSIVLSWKFEICLLFASQLCIYKHIHILILPALSFIWLSAHINSAQRSSGDEKMRILRLQYVMLFLCIQRPNQILNRIFLFDVIDAFSILRDQKHKYIKSRTYIHTITNTNETKHIHATMSSARLFACSLVRTQIHCVNWIG